jgi:hypothetical protein
MHCLIQEKATKASSRYLNTKKLDDAKSKQHHIISQHLKYLYINKKHMQKNLLSLQVQIFYFLKVLPQTTMGILLKQVNVVVVLCCMKGNPNRL